MTTPAQPHGFLDPRSASWFYSDTEFLPSDPTTRGLAAIALVDRAGHQYYAVNADLDTAAVFGDERNAFFRDHVWPLLPLADDGRTLDLTHPDVQSPDRIRADIAAFIADVAERGRPRLAAWKGSQDIGRIHQLWGNDWDAFPFGLPDTFTDLETETLKVGLRDHLPDHPGRLHHALDDALWDMAVHDMLAAVNEPITPLWDRPVSDVDLHNDLARLLQELTQLSTATAAGHIRTGVPASTTARLRALADEVHGLAVRLGGTLPVPYLHRTERADLPHDPYMELVDSALTNVGLRPARWWSRPSGARLDGGFWLDTAHLAGWPGQVRLYWNQDSGWTITYGTGLRTTEPLGVHTYAAPRHVAAATRALLDRQPPPTGAEHWPLAAAIAAAVGACQKT
ncbi:hypothetical protein ACFWXO_16410 [Kitasatospora sp. NPDC059088]|uniref:hypothetical protein n=1 Tax=Kitasatospora sp. NPDC059088 TaxID=3346722 RepID=UPI0036A7D39B